MQLDIQTLVIVFGLITIVEAIAFFCQYIPCALIWPYFERLASNFFAFVRVYLKSA